MKDQSRRMDNANKCARAFQFFKVFDSVFYIAKHSNQPCGGKSVPWLQNILIMQHPS